MFSLIYSFLIIQIIKFEILRLPFLYQNNKTGNLQNVWTVRNFFIKKYGTDPPVINEDQMLVHRNENASQKTLAVKGLDTYVKENYMLSHERATVFTQISSDSSINLKPEFVFKGKGTQIKLNPPSGIKFQWSENGSYRIDQLK